MNTPSRFHRLTVTQIRELTVDAVAVRFSIPDEIADIFQFIPGQYLTLLSTIDGEEIRRPYSICSACGLSYVEVGIKRVDGGVFSTFAQDLKVGDEIDVMAPQGRFNAMLGGAHEYILVAAGSGITPVLSIASSVLTNEPDSRITLLYANRSSTGVMFLDDIDALKDRYAHRFSVIHVLSGQEQDVPLLSGRLDHGKIAALAEGGLILPDNMDGIFICGPAALIETCRKSFRDLGVADENIHFELFTPAEPRVDYSPVKSGAVGPLSSKNSVDVEVVLDGIRKNFKVDGSTQTVLQAARDVGIDLPFSCAGGMCCTCRCKVVSGVYEMDVRYSLQEWEIDAGYALACQLRPGSEKLVLDFDAS